MPIYEYTCQKCGAHMEVMQKISDKPLSRHARCGGRLAKEWSQTSFQLKGSGWYVTDYAGKKAESKESKSDSSETKKDAKAEPKSSSTESKSASSTDAKEPKGKSKASAASAGD